MSITTVLPYSIHLSSTRTFDARLFTTMRAVTMRQHLKRLLNNASCDCAATTWTRATLQISPPPTLGPTHVRTTYTVRGEPLTARNRQLQGATRACKCRQSCGTQHPANADRRKGRGGLACGGVGRCVWGAGSGS